MRLGVIGRADRSGIAVQTLDVARHLPVHAALVLDLRHKGRGPFAPADWVGKAEEVRFHSGLPGLEEVDWLIDECDVIFTVETTYVDSLAARCARAGVKLVIHVNPELWQWKYAEGGEPVLALPTGWQADQFPGAVSLPMPVDVDRFPFTERSDPTTFVHVAASAMADRNGTGVVDEMLHHVMTPITLFTRGVARGDSVTERVGLATVHHLAPADENTSLFPEEASWLVLPRRYGGLSLTVQEAAASGLPALMPHLPPNHEYTQYLFPVAEFHEEWMAAGYQRVWHPDPADWGRRVSALARSDPAELAEVSRLTRERAELRSWRRWRDRWLEVLAP